MNIYLDIDGVLLANDKEKALYVKEFLAYVLAHFPDTTYWLTTHCMRGDPDEPIRNVGHLFDTETVSLMRKIKPTAWNIAKTEAIDFSKPFLWFDDDLYPEEHHALEAKGALLGHVMVDLSKDPAQLRALIQNFPKPHTP
jgi:hypothetical protein